MKSKRLLAMAIGLCTLTQGYAEESFSFLDSKQMRQEYADASGQSVDSWGTDQSNHVNDGKILVGFHSNKDGSVTRTAYPNTLIADLKPRGSQVAHNGFNAQAEGLVEQIWPLPGGHVLFSAGISPQRHNYLYKFNPKTGTVGNNPPLYDNKQAVMNMGERGNVPQADIRALHHRSLLVADMPNKTKALFYGEYNVNNKDSWVALWKSTNMGDTWSKVIEWNKVGTQTGHIHGMVQNPYNGWIYFLFGDKPAESGIVAWDGKSPFPPDNTPLDKMSGYLGWKAITGSPRLRTGDLVFTPPPEGKCVWIPDADALGPGEKMYGQRANYDLSGLEATGEVPYLDHIPPILGVRSSSGNIYWASFRDRQAAEKKIHLWKSTDNGLKWSLAFKVDVYNELTAVPHNLRVQGNILNSQVSDLLSITARDLEFVANGKSVGSTVRFASKTVNSNPAPQAMPDTLVTRAGQSGTVNVALNDINAQGGTAQIVGAPKNGVALPGCCGAVEYTPKLGFAGVDGFSYVLASPSGQSNTSSVTVYVLAAKNDLYASTANTYAKQSVVVNAANTVLKNDLPANIVGRKITVTSRIKRIAGRGKGTVSLKFNANGSFSYTLAAPPSAATAAQKQAAKRGTYQFTYTSSLNGVTTLPAKVTLVVK